MTPDAAASPYYLDPNDRSGLERYARRGGFLSAEETLVSVAKAGEGNMNLTLRLTTAKRSFIVKQARPWVEKYPQIPAPSERALVELAFYRAAATRPGLEKAMPKLLGADRNERVIVLEDLGDARDMTTLYSRSTLALEDLRTLVAYLATLHEPFGGLDDETRETFQNRAMRELNHEHIFRLPLLEENGLDLDAITPGLAEASFELKRDRAYVDRVDTLGAIYLADGNGDVLVHGDYFPGSWLRTRNGLRVIDPEFCFLGTAAFDLGVMLAHLFLARQPRELEEALFDAYDGSSLPLARQFAGVEIMRRLLGVAQLPLDYGIEDKATLLQLSRELVLSGDAP